MLPILDSRNDLSIDPATDAPWFDVLAPRMAAAPINADDPDSAMGARRQLEARAQHDTWDRLASVETETFVIGGKYDGQAPVDNVERLADRLPNSRLELFDGGHLFLLQDTTAWPAVIGFLHERATT